MRQLCTVVRVQSGAVVFEMKCHGVCYNAGPCASLRCVLQLCVHCAFSILPRNSFCVCGTFKGVWDRYAWSCVRVSLTELFFSTLCYTLLLICSGLVVSESGLGLEIACLVHLALCFDVHSCAVCFQLPGCDEAMGDPACHMSDVPRE
jgi:hypothetical protein